MSRRRGAAVVSLGLGAVLLLGATAAAEELEGGPTAESTSAVPEATSSPLPSPSASASPVASPAPTASPVPLTSQTGTATPPPQEGSAELIVTTASSPVLVTVGDLINYTLVVENTGTAAAEDVVVLDLVPAEVHVVAASLENADAVQVGRTGSREDIVWVIENLPAGEEAELRWTGLATGLGDFAADNSARATAGEISSPMSANRTYLGGTRRPNTANPPFTPAVERRVVFEESSAGDGEDAVNPALLPATGSPQDLFAIGGVILIATGLVLLWSGGSPGARRLRRLGFIALLVLAACTSDGGDSAQPSSTAEPQVKGTRITPGDDTTEPDDDDVDGEEGEGPGRDVFAPPGGEEDEGPTDGVVPPPGETVTPPTDTILPPTEAPEFIRTVEVDVITLADLPVRTLGSRDGDNTVRYQWNENARELVFATSGRLLTEGQDVELLASVTDDGEGIQVEVTLRNTAELERVSVTGHIAHTVAGPQGTLTTLRSPRVDVVLDPGGQTTATFNYMLPSDTYVGEASFEAD